MNQQQAQNLAKRIMREEPRFTAIPGTESQVGPDFWVVRLFVEATGEPRDVMESESDWEELKQILQSRGDW